MSELANVVLFDIEKYGQPPLPSKNDPYVQVKWLFEKRANRATSKHTKSTYQISGKRVIKYLQSQRGNEPFLLDKHIDEFFFIRLKRVIDLHKNVTIDGPELATHTLVSFLSAVRQTLKDALAYGLLSCDSLLNANSQSGVRETDRHKDYSEKELQQILSVLNAEMKLVIKILNGYIPLQPGEGRDPRIKSETNPCAKLNDPGHGWKVKANLQWYFENVMDATASFASKDENRSNHKQFYHHASVTHGGMLSVYHGWGVTPLITRNLIMPAVVNLVYLTGLNPDSLLELKVDSYVDEHPLTNMPFIKFEKRRSRGEKELHLSLLDGIAEQPLKRKQAINVKRAFDVLIRLTKQIRVKLNDDEELKNRLVIYESASRTKYSKVIHLSPAQTSGWCREMVKKYDMRNDNGEPLDFNLVRFRSTKLTEMALSGRDLFEIQQVAQHKNITTTLLYINKNKLDVQAKKVVSQALQQISENRIEVLGSCSTKNHSYQPIKIFKGLISDCKNAFDPPDAVKSLKGYTPGTACVRFNMCLFCKNVIIMREHLPALAAYRNQILSIHSNNIQNLPNSDFYDKSLELLDQLFDREKSEFSGDDLDWAIEMSETMDIMVDPLIYQGVEK